MVAVVGQRVDAGLLSEVGGILLADLLLEHDLGDLLCQLP